MSGSASFLDGVLTTARTVFPQATLAVFGAVLLALVPAGLVWSRLDRRQIRGESVAAKPTKFLLSIGVHALTLSWAFGYVQVDRQHAVLPTITVWTVVVSSVWELACIISQAVRGRMSHFNHATRYDSLLFASMGVFATLLVVANLPLAWELALWPGAGTDPVMISALVLGLLVSCFAGGATGLLMGGRNAHGVGRETARLPLLGWSATSGDFRVPHFLGIHAVQALPMIAAGLVLLVSSRLATTLFTFAAVLYGALTVAMFVQALRGRPLAPASLLQRAGTIRPTD